MSSMTTLRVSQQFTCDGCRQQKPGKRAKNDGIGPPQGWKRIRGQLLCKVCAKESYCLRCVSFRVASPVDASWDELRAALRYSWGETTRIANWAIRTLAVNDVPCVGFGEKVQPMPKIYLYGELNKQKARRSFPADSVLAALARAEALYKRDRFDVLRGHASLSRVRYPQPLEMKPRGKTLEAGERITVTLRIPTAEGESREFRVLVAQGWENRRTTAAMRKMLTREVELRAISVTEQGKHIMLRCVAMFPREVKERDGTLYVRSTSEVFCEAISVQKSRLWVLHADLCRRWIAEHSRKMQHLSDDQKAEQRSAKARKRFQAARDALCDKHHRRMRTFMQQAAAMVAGWALRINADSVLWDGWDDKKSAPDTHCFDSFPWHEFREMVRHRLHRDGVELICRASDEVAAEPA